MNWTAFFLHRSRPGAAVPSCVASWVNGVLAAALVLVAGGLVINGISGGLHWSAVTPYWPLFWKGWLLSLGLSVAALVLSLLIGLAAALAQRSPVILLRYLARIYVELVRGTPLLVQILIWWYVVFASMQSGFRPGIGILALAFFSGAYLSEILRAGIESVGQSQRESARAIGLTNAQTYRYVIFPQALRQVLPPLAGQFASLIKDSSLLSVIGITDLTQTAQNVNAITYSSLEAFLPLAAGYLVLTLPISLWTRSLERKVRYET